jgi:hypothetical protein
MREYRAVTKHVMRDYATLIFGFIKKRKFLRSDPARALSSWDLFGFAKARMGVWGG